MSTCPGSVPPPSAYPTPPSRPRRCLVPLRSWIGWTLALALFAALTAGAVWLLRDAPAEVRSSVAVAEAMAGDTTGYARAVAPRPFVFPGDHGPHPAFKLEWWYLTGNLAGPEGRRFGYQFTLFRNALAPEAPARASAWGTNQLYMGHFAVTDAAGRRFYAFERFSRGAVGLAGAQAAPFRAWLEDWSLDGPPQGAAQGADGLFPLRLRAAEEGAALSLTLTPRKPLVLQGDRGFDPKGSEPGNASYYYSYTRLHAEGTITLGGQTFPVEGLSWMDREWSTSALGAGQVGWDWFSLQLDEGRELMYYRLRLRGGGISPDSGGLLVRADGSTRPLARDDVAVSVLRRWTSPRGGAYPTRWRLRVPAEGLDLTVDALLPDQELDVSVRYWEGAVRVSGTATGYGYVELTGYADAPAGDDGAEPLRTSPR